MKSGYFKSMLARGRTLDAIRWRLEFSGSNLGSKIDDGIVAGHFFLVIFNKRRQGRIQNLRRHDLRFLSHIAQHQFGRGGLLLLMENTPDWLFWEALQGSGYEALNRDKIFDVGRGCFRVCRSFHSLLRLLPLRDFYKCCQLAAGLRKRVKDVGNILRAELKLPSSESQAEDFVDFLSLGLGEIVLLGRIYCAVLIILFPLKHGLQTTAGVLIQFLNLWSWCGTFRQHVRLTVGECHGYFCQPATQFLNLVGRQRSLATDPLSARLVEINRGAKLMCFIFEHWERFEGWPLAGQE